MHYAEKVAFLMEQFINDKCVGYDCVSNHCCVMLVGLNAMAIHAYKREKHVAFVRANRNNALVLPIF